MYKLTRIFALPVFSMQKNYTTYSPEETKAVAAELASFLKGGEEIALVGDLGAGKTTFVQGLAQALGSQAKVKSPTFTLMNIYPVVHPTIKQIAHLDYYRLQETGASDLGLDEYKTPDTVIVSEWPIDVAPGKNKLFVQLTGGKNPNERSITIER